MKQYIGQTLGSYQILEQIGKGGMATIFKAYQPSMDRYVAVKILGSTFTEDESFAARFNQEARTLARLEHLHILPVHDYGEQEGIAYLVMRYIDAGTLKDLIAQKAPMELSEVARIMGQIGGALGYAHSQGVIHRDIKPTNVLVDGREDAFLTDFGIAKLMAGTSQLTASGAIVGTPAYMSPEQGLGQPVDHRSDIYALGVVLYEMVTGQVPYEAETPLAVLLKHVNEPLPPPRQVKPDLPESVERVILKALTKSPDERFQTVEAMVEALQRAVAGLPTEVAIRRTPVVEPAEPVSGPPEPATVAAPGRRPLPLGLEALRSRLWVSVVGVLGVLVVALAFVLLVLPGQDGGGQKPTPTEALAVARLPTESSSGEAAEPAPAEVLTEEALASTPTPAPQPATLPAPAPEARQIVVDNQHRAFAIESGEWGACWDGECGGVCYDEDFRYAEPTCADCRASFRFDVAVSGWYDVWAWWPQGDDRATDTPFTIVYSGGSQIVMVDQRNNGSDWYPLGSFSFLEGESASVLVGSSDTGYANADAVALTPAGTGPPTLWSSPGLGAGPLLDDFEGGDLGWWFFVSEGTMSFDCGLDKPGRDSAHGLRLSFEVGLDSWPGCAINVDPQGWQEAEGISFFWRSDQPDLGATLVMNVEDPTQTYPESEGVTPFEVTLSTPGETWTQVTLEWDDLFKGDWVGESGVELFDPSRVVELILQVDPEQSGVIWVDDLQLMTGPDP